MWNAEFLSSRMNRCRFWKNASLVYFRSACISLHQLHNIMQHSSQPTRLSFNYDDWNVYYVQSVCRRRVKSVETNYRRWAIHSSIRWHLHISRSYRIKSSKHRMNRERERSGKWEKKYEKSSFSQMRFDSVSSTQLSTLSSWPGYHLLSQRKKIGTIFRFDGDAQVHMRSLFFIVCCKRERYFRDWMESHKWYNIIA